MGSGRPAIVFLCICGIAVLLYFYTRRTRPSSKPAILEGDPPSSIADPKVKIYAGWLDKIEEIAGKMKAGTIREATAEMIGNASALADLSDQTLRLVIEYWQVRRGRPISTHSAFVSFYDESESTRELFNRVRNLKYFEI